MLCNIDEFVKSHKIPFSDLDGFVKSSNSRRANFVIMRRTFRTLNDCEMQHNAEVGLFTRPSNLKEEKYIMPLSVVDLYRDVLPKTNCGDCGFPACLAFASIVVSEKLPLGNCPHIDVGVIENCQKELDEQYASGKWLKRDMAKDALEWAKQRSASVKIENLPDRIGGKLIKKMKVSLWNFHILQIPLL